MFPVKIAPVKTCLRLPIKSMSMKLVYVYQFSNSIENEISSVEFSTGVASFFNGDGPPLKFNDSAILKKVNVNFNLYYFSRQYLISKYRSKLKII
jgi:hypothetical protein